MIYKNNRRWLIVAALMLVMPLGGMSNPQEAKQLSYFAQAKHAVQAYWQRQDKKSKVLLLAAAGTLTAIVVGACIVWKWGMPSCSHRFAAPPSMIESKSGMQVEKEKLGAKNLIHVEPPLPRNLAGVTAEEFVDLIIARIEKLVEAGKIFERGTDYHSIGERVGELSLSYYRPGFQIDFGTKVFAIEYSNGVDAYYQQPVYEIVNNQGTITHYVIRRELRYPYEPELWTWGVISLIERVGKKAQLVYNDGVDEDVLFKFLEHLNNARL